MQPPDLRAGALCPAIAGQERPGGSRSSTITEVSSFKPPCARRMAATSRPGASCAQHADDRSASLHALSYLCNHVICTNKTDRRLSPDLCCKSFVRTPQSARTKRGHHGCAAEVRASFVCRQALRLACARAGGPHSAYTTVRVLTAWTNMLRACLGGPRTGHACHAIRLCKCVPHAVGCHQHAPARLRHAHLTEAGP